MNAATRAVIERLVEALEQYAPRDRAVTQDLIAGARKLLEGDALTQPADNDAWLEKAVDIAQEFDDRAFRADTEIQLRAHLRTRPAREGFVSVPVETLEAMRKDARYVEYGRVAMRFVDRAGDVHPGIDDAETICAEFYEAMSKAVDAAMIEAAKGDTNADV